MAPSEREFKIKNVPDNECIVVCVVSLEEVEPSHHLELESSCILHLDHLDQCFIPHQVEITPSNVPFPQCREIRTEGVGESKRLDNIIIPASTAIVVCVIVAVIIFIACLKVAYFLLPHQKKYILLPVEQQEEPRLGGREAHPHVVDVDERSQPGGDGSTRPPWSSAGGSCLSWTRSSWTEGLGQHVCLQVGCS